MDRRLSGEMGTKVDGLLAVPRRCRAEAWDVRMARLADRLASVDNEQHRLLDAKAARDQVREQVGDDGGVLRGASPDAQRGLGAIGRDAERNEHGMSGELDAVNEHRDQVDVVDV